MIDKKMIPDYEAVLAILNSTPDKEQAAIAVVREMWSRE